MKKTICSVIILGTAWIGSLAASELRIFPAVELEFSTVLGGSYQIQASSNLVDWSDFEQPIPGDGTTVNRLYSTKGTPYRFFRVIPDLPPAGALIGYTDCKSAGADPPQGGQAPSASEECLQFDWNGQGTLTLKHVNAGFNCCPDRLVGSVAIQDQTITLTESEIGGLCNCNCLYDLDYEITQLKPGRYTLQVVPTGYVPPGDPLLSFAVDLVGPTNGIECVLRSGYPWEPPTPIGGLVDYGDCKSSLDLVSVLTASLGAPSSSEGCLEYEYEAATGTLRLTHVNAAFNCCSQIIRGDITIAHSQISIVESEAGGICHCLCLYDLKFEIRNLVSGTYTVDVTEPLLPSGDPKLTVTLDLAASPTGCICLPRSSYPWGY